MFAPIAWQGAAPATLVARVAEAGVIGMGGAGFPTHVKLAPPPNKPVDTLILNGAECEPYLTADHRLMLERAEETWEGCRILQKILGVKTLRLAIEPNKPDAIETMQAAMDRNPLPGVDAKIFVLRNVYPQGAEKQQIRAVTGRVIPAGRLPMDVGCAVENVATAFAIFEAVVRGLPLTHRIVTVSGDAVRAPANLWVPNGTPFSDLIEACGGAAESLVKIVAGGPMMGFAQPDASVAVARTTSGLLLLSAGRTSLYSPRPCVSCGRCVEACPMLLTPAELSQCIEAGDFAAAEALFVKDCYECGACSYVCPCRRPLVQHMRRAKAGLLTGGKK